MYTVLENARIVLALLKEHNIRHIVLSPGGSNIPIVQGVQQDSFFTCYSVVDERSAMYFAIGLYLKLGVPIATSCTSAQATRNYIPGLTEAFYKHVPILAITMSKHPRYLYQGYMQCPIQTSLPEDCVKKSYSLPYVSNANDRAQCIRVANEAILELTHHGLGPVQLNLEELDSETWLLDETTQLSPVRKIERYELNDNWTFDFIGKKIMLVIGEHRPFSEKEAKAIDSFCEKTNIFVYVNHVSNYHGKYARIAYTTINSMTQKAFDEGYAPDILLTIGGLTGDYGIYGKLFSSSARFEHWRIDVDGNVVDTYGKLTRIYQSTIENFFTRAVIDLDSVTHEYFNKWINILGKRKLDMELPFSNLYAAQQLHTLIPANSILNFAILNSFRVWSNFEIDPSIQCFSNIAAFGIDGCMSVMIGESVETDELTFLITGDLAFFYDLNALGIRHIKNNVRILLVNNNGGAEFKLGSLQNRTEVSQFIAADGHFKDANGWAETNDFIYLSANDKSEFKKNIKTFLGKANKSIIWELFTKAEDEKNANRIMMEDNLVIAQSERMKNGLKSIIKDVLSEKGYHSVKTLLGK